MKEIKRRYIFVSSLNFYGILHVEEIERRHIQEQVDQALLCISSDSNIQWGHAIGVHFVFGGN